jgi:hypothetical protein
MSWAEWLSAFGLTAAGTVLAVAFYFHWTFRYRVRRLGLVSEVALAAFIVCGGLWAIAALWRHMP